MERANWNLNIAKLFVVAFLWLTLASWGFSLWKAHFVVRDFTQLSYQGEIVMALEHDVQDKSSAKESSDDVGIRFVLFSMFFMITVFQTWASLSIWRGSDPICVEDPIKMVCAGALAVSVIEESVNGWSVCFGFLVMVALVSFGIGMLIKGRTGGAIEVG